MQGVDEAQIHVPGEATYKFPIFSSTCSLYGHAELLYIGGIKEYILNQEKFTTRSEAIQGYFMKFLLTLIQLLDFSRPKTRSR
jgi:hypothetical protein